jgi:hypothetical protein
VPIHAHGSRPKLLSLVPSPGGKLIITANEVEEYGRARMVLRIKLKTTVGDRQHSRDVNISLIPRQ